MSPTVTAAIIAAGVSFVTLLIGQYFTRRATRQDLEEQGKRLDKTLKAQGDQLDKTLTEQRIRTLNERFATAAEQLGSDKPAVRLAGMHAMAGLAGDWPENRQTCVDVLCAYLRMPFSPTAPASNPGPGDTVDQAERDTEAQPRTDGTGDTWQQERQVRLTAQRILATHLRDDRAIPQRLTDPPGPHFWPDIRLDLSGATLIDFDLDGGAMAAANFDGATFSGDAWFRKATFTGEPSFSRATFSGRALFLDAIFGGHAMFVHAIFSSDAEFNRAIFVGDAVFVDATFTAAAWFEQAAFAKEANFGGATFSSASDFKGATFSGAATFRDLTYRGRASGGHGVFFDQSRVLSPDGHDWPEGWRREPDGSGGYTVARANAERKKQD